MQQDFYSFSLPTTLLTTIKGIGYVSPTDIQSQAIPLLMSGKDLIGTSQTGTGKTAAFVIPIIAKLLERKESNALILAPTRELALQIQEVVDKLIPFNIKFSTALLIGGAPMFKQVQQLRAKPRIIIATPGRLKDHLARKNCNLKFYDILVLDEFDRMLDIGFSVQIEQIVKYLPQPRQTIMFSATLTSEIMQLSKKYLNDPKIISIGSSNVPVKNIEQKILNTTQQNKYQHLSDELLKRDGSIIIFVNTKSGADKLSIKLNKDNHNASSLHGDLPHNKRSRVIDKFRAQGFRIMVATDIAARGLDINHVRHVINYDLPRCPEDYIHRIGRTARAGSDGSALNLLLPEDGKRWKVINNMMSKNHNKSR